MTMRTIGGGSDQYRGGLLALPGYSTAQWAAGSPPSFSQMTQDGPVSSQVPYGNGNLSQGDLQALAKLGWTGNPYNSQALSDQSGGEQGMNVAGTSFGINSSAGLSPEFQQFMQSNGLRLMSGQGPSGYASQIYDAQGNPIGPGAKYGGGSEGDAFGIGTLFAGGLAGGAAAGLGAADAGAAGAADAGGVGSAFGGVPAGGQFATDAGTQALTNAGAFDASMMPGGASAFAPAGAQDAAMNAAIAGGSTSPTLSDLLNPAGKAAGALGGQGGQNLGVGAALAAALAGGANLSNAGNVPMPNYTGAANSAAQSARTNQTNPLGSSQWTQTGTDAQGNPIWSQNTSLTGAGQQNLNAAQGAQGHAINALGQDQSAQIQQAQQAAYDKQTAMLDPQYAQQQQQLQTQLANQGIGIGSEAYNNATGNFARQRDYAYGNARDSAIGIGDQMQQQLFGQNLQAAGGLGNVANQIGSPSFMQTPQPTNYIGAAALQGQGLLNQYNAQTGANNSFTNGLFNLGGSVLSNPNWTGLIGNLFTGGSTPGP